MARSASSARRRADDIPAQSSIVRRLVRAYVEITRGGAGEVPDGTSPDEPKAESSSVPVPAPDPTPRATAPTVLGIDVRALAGAPPEMPAEPPRPTAMPGPRDIPAGNPDDPEPPPGVVPRGDSRSLRRGTEFALIYRRSTFVIARFGTVGKRGQWRVVEYPTPGSASHAYAQECSRWVSEGYSDYRG